MTITESYRDYRLGKITKARFMERARKDHHLKGLVNNVMSFDDTVKVLKNRGIISEAPIIIPAEVRKGVNFELGLTYEPIPDWTDHDFYTEEDVKKVEAKVIKNLEKDPVYYTKLIGTGEKPGGDKTEYGVEYKESNVSDTTNKTKGDGYVKKEVKKDAESNVQTSLSKSEAKKGKPEGVQQLKEGLKGKFDSDDNIYTYDHLINTDSPNKEQLAKVKAAIEADKEELKKKGKKAKYVKGDTVPYLELVEGYKGKPEGVKQLKESYNSVQEGNSPTITSIELGRDSGYSRGAIGNYYSVRLSNGESLEVSDDELLERYEELRNLNRIPSFEELRSLLVGKEWEENLYESSIQEGDDLDMLLSKVYDIGENSGDMNLYPELEALISQYKTAQGILSPEGVKKVESFLISNDLEDLVGYIGGDAWTRNVQNTYTNRKDTVQSFQDASDLSEKKPLKNLTKDRLREVIRKHVKEAIFQKGKETVTASSPTSTGILKQKGYRPVSGTDDAKPIA